MDIHVSFLRYSNPGTRLCLHIGWLFFFVSLLNRLHVTAAVICPQPCTCLDEANLTVDCSGKVLTSPPATSNATLNLNLSNNSLGPTILKLPIMVDLTNLDLSRNGLTQLLACTFSGMFKLEKLNLRGNKLTELPDTLFSSSPKIKILDLSDNTLIEIPDDPLRHLSELKYLDLSSNRFTNLRLGSRFQVPRNLNHLDLSNNQFTNITQESFAITNQWQLGEPRTLRLANCNISFVEPGSFLKFPSLDELDLSGNEYIPIQNLTAIIKELETIGLQGNSLKNLSIAGTNISTLGPLFRNVTRLGLKFLNVSHNNIHHVPQGVFTTIQSLRTLDISHNKLTSLEAGFSDLKNLRFLKICHNQLENFQQTSASGMVDLRKLDVSHNKLDNQVVNSVSFASLNKLKDLDVSNNLMRSVVLPSNTSSLQFLDYHANRIRNFALINNPRSLEYIDMSDNDLTIVNPYLFSGSTKMKKANFSRNDITTIGNNAFKPLSPLVIDLSHNQISHVQNYLNWNATERLLLNNNNIKTVESHAFFKMSGLQILDLSNNELNNLDKNVLQGLNALKYVNVSHNFLQGAEWLYHYFGMLETLDISSNNLTGIKEDLFDTLTKLRVLSLARNKIKAIFPRVFRDLDSLTQLDLSHNPLSCTCDLLAFRDYTRRESSPLSGLQATNSTAYTCQSPPHRLGIHVTSWEPDQLECDQTLLYLVIFGSVGAFFVVAGVLSTMAYRLYKRLKARWRRLELLEGAKKKRNWEKENKEKDKDSGILSGEEIAEEIKRTVKRQEEYLALMSSRGQRDNSYVDIPGEGRRYRADGRYERRYRDDWLTEGKYRVENKEAEELSRRMREENIVYVDSGEMGRERRINDRERSWNEKLRKEERNAADQRRTSRERDGPKDKKKNDQKSGKSEEPGRDKGRRHERESEYIPAESRESARGRRSREDVYYRDLPRPELGRYVHGPNPLPNRHRSPRRPAPYIIAPAHMYPQDFVSVWERPRGWMPQGQVAGRYQGHGRDRDGYLTLPAGRERVIVRPAIRASVHDLDRAPQEVRFRQGNDDYDDVVIGRHERDYYQARPASYQHEHLPNSGRQSPPVYVTAEEPPQRQYERIEPRREPLKQRSQSQPYLPQETSSGWM